MMPQAQPSFSLESMQRSSLPQSERKTLGGGRAADRPPASTAPEATACQTSVDPLLINNSSTFTSELPQSFPSADLPAYQPSISSPFGDFLSGDLANLGGMMSAAPNNCSKDPSLVLPPFTPDNDFNFASYVRDPATVSARPSSLSASTPLPAGQKPSLRSKARSTSSSRPQGKTRSSLSKQAADRMLKPSPQHISKSGNNKNRKLDKTLRGLEKKDIQSRSDLLHLKAWEELPSDVADVPIW